MLLGIDVGGTFTDAVLIEDGKVVNYAKYATTYPNVLAGILGALDKVLLKINIEKIERVTISSTIVTNSLLENKTDKVLLVVMPGPGINVGEKFPVKPYIIKGYVDHRGKVLSEPVFIESRILQESKVTKNAVVSGKFSVRNQSNERKLRKFLIDFGFKKIYCGADMSSELNFIRRTNSACFSAMVANVFETFVKQVKLSLTKRKINVPIQILKADGSSLPIDKVYEKPVEAVFTGPAASVLGIEALGVSNKKAISLDVGGTTTDIAFWEDGRPLQSKKGIKIDKYFTSVQGFFMKSVGIGGDSLLRRSEKFTVGPDRIGPAMALGGNKPTLTDALLLLGLIDYGDKKKAKLGFLDLVKDGETVLEIAEKFVNIAVLKLKDAIDNMIEELSLQPVYEVNDIFNSKRFKPKVLIGVGGGSLGLIKELGKVMEIDTIIPTGAIVANAIGAAVAKITLEATLRVDTTEGYYTINDGNIKQKCSSGFDLKEAKKVLGEFLLSKANEVKITNPKLEVKALEEFFTIHDYLSTGKIINLKMQVKSGDLNSVVCKEASFK
jgi:N-methylhydantoinase A/oxoprolinase/acetone carboxylase beta subunit